jgi:lipopolysaccharide export system protein LptA
VGDPEFGRLVERRRKRILRLIVAALVVTAVVVAVAFLAKLKKAPAGKSLAGPQTVPTNVDQQASGYTFTRSDNGRQVFIVHAARTVAFKEGGATVLNDVWVEMFGRAGGRHDLLRTSQCTYNRESGELFTEQKVEIELNAPSGAFPDAGTDPAKAQSVTAGGQTANENNGRLPVYLETSHLSFTHNGAMLLSDAPVRFRVGPASGTAVGLKYATHDDWLELSKNVVVDSGVGSRGEFSSPVQLEADRLRFDKSAGVITLAGPVRVLRQDRRVTAAGGRILLDNKNRVRLAELEGDVNVVVPSAQGAVHGTATRVRGEFDPVSMQVRTLTAEGGVQGEMTRNGKVIHLAAQQLRLNLSGTPQRPADGVATGDVRLTTDAAQRPAADSPAKTTGPDDLASTNQELTASALKFSFDPSGERLRESETVGGGRIVLTPRDPKVGKRVITAEPLVTVFDKAGQPSVLRGLSNSRIVFMPPAGAPPGSPATESHSRELQATFDPASKTLRAVDQTGNFQIEQGDWHAFADRAHYEAANEIVTLVGRPRVQDGQSRMQADRMLVDLRAETAEGLGHVKATHVESSADGGALPQGDPTNVVADRMLAKRQSQFVHYEGNVRVWHGKDVVESSSIDVYKAERRVRSGSRVLTSFLQPGAATTGADKPAGTVKSGAPVTIRADDLEYFDEGRRASYRGNVQLETENTSLRADRLDVFFSAKGSPGASEVERAVAEGHVTVVQPTRRVTGERAEYFAAPGKILMTGGPPALYDAEKGFTTGQRLTFFIHDDRIFLDGGEESPTLSRHRIPQ